MSRFRFASTGKAIRLLHKCEEAAVEEAAIALFWYFVFRVEGKIQRKEPR